MAVTSDFLEFVKEQLAPLHEVGVYFRLKRGARAWTSSPD